MKTSNYLAKLPQGSNYQKHPGPQGLPISSLLMYLQPVRGYVHCGSNDCVIKDSGHTDHQAHPM